MEEYTRAEVAGREASDCSHYEAACTKSLFKLSKYSREAQGGQGRGVSMEQVPSIIDPIINEVF